MAGPKYKGTQMRAKKLAEMIEEKVNEAKQVCEGDATSDECKVAWDEVEEVSQAKADLRLKLEVEKLDPLESFCQDNPETEECRIYEDWPKAAQRIRQLLPVIGGDLLSCVTQSPPSL